jgi:hypothetical protein
MADLPTVNAIEDLKESNKEQREKLQKSMREGMRLNRVELANINNTLIKAFSINQEMLNLSKMIRAEEYERWLEAQRQNEDEDKPAEVKIDKSGFDQSWLLPLLGIGGLLSAFTALAASVTGLDAALKAINLPNTFKAIKSPFKGIEDYFNKIRDMKKPKIPDMPKIKFVDLEGKPYDFKKFNIKIRKLPDFGISNWFNTKSAEIDAKLVKGGKSISQSVDSIGNRFTSIAESFAKSLDGVRQTLIGGGRGGTLFTGILSGLTSIIDEFTKPIRLFVETNPFTERFGKIRKGFEDIFNGLPRIEIELPTWAKNIPQNIKSLIGNAEDGTGILGFFSKAFSFLEPVLSPLKKVIGTIFRPFTQILLTVIDFVVGFYEGFTGAEGSLMDKLGAGLEGGIKGIIKGITEAIDLIFIQFPAWILGKLGFEDTANNLKEFSLTDLVDPIWDSIKKFFTTLISGDISGAAGMVVGGVEDFFKAVLRAVLPDPTADYGFFDPRTALQKVFKAMGAYKYAGINADTGELIAPPPTAPPTTGAEVDVRSREVASKQTSPVINVTAPQTNMTTDNSVRVQKTTMAAASPRRGASSPQTRDYDPVAIGGA